MITIIAHKIVRFLMRLLFVFPINKNKIILNSQKGRMYACNPRALFEYLYIKNPNKYEFIWVLNTESEDFNNFVNDGGKVRIVRYNTFRYFFHHLTSKVIISNIHSPIYLPLRKKQVMINTWHGGGAYKRVGLKTPKQESLSKKEDSSIIKTLENKDNQAWEIYKSKYNALDTTYFISSSEVFTDAMLDSQQISSEKYLEIGMPRNDVFFKENSHLKDKAKKILGINNEISVVFFAPTYRGNVKTQNFGFDIDVNLILETAKAKWGGEWIFVFRGHIWGETDIEKKSKIINASKYEEMQELLIMADVFITDYSSSIWDFALTKKPAFLFTPDLEYYEKGDRGFYTPIESWPFNYAKTNDDLKKLILEFNEESHKLKIEQYLKTTNSLEKGKASSEIAKLIKKYK